MMAATSCIEEANDCRTRHLKYIFETTKRDGFILAKTKKRLRYDP